MQEGNKYMKKLDNSDERHRIGLFLNKKLNDFVWEKAKKLGIKAAGVVRMLIIEAYNKENGTDL